MEAAAEPRVVGDPYEGPVVAEPGAAAAYCAGRTSCWAYVAGEVREFRDNCTPATLLGFDLLFIVGAWIATGTAVFYLSAQKSIQGEFTGAYSFFYSANIGLGVGNVPYQPTLGAVEVFECFYCCTGNCLVVGGLGVYYRILSERADRQQIFGRDGGPSKKVVFGAAYAVVVTYGCLVAYCAAGYTAFVDLLLWSVTYLQTSGLLLGHYTFQNFMATGVFLIVGIPIAGIFMAELCDNYFDYHERVTIQRRASIIRVPLRGRTHSMHQPAVAKPLLPPEKEDVAVRSDVLSYLEGLAASLAPRSGDGARPRPAKDRRDRADSLVEPYVDDLVCGAECGDLFMPEWVGDLWHRWHVWRAGYDPLQVLAMDLGASVAVWICVGTMWFTFFQMDNGWSASYSIYYAVNVGMGVGSAKKHAGGAISKWFEVFFCICGSVLIVGGIGLTFRISSDRAKRYVAGSDHPEKIARFKIAGFSPVISVLGSFYVFMVGVGVVIAYYCCGFRRVDDLFLWTITNMTTAGLRVSQHGEPHYHFYAFTAAYMLVGIPASAIFYAEVAAELFDYHEKAVVTHRLSMMSELHLGVPHDDDDVAVAAAEVKSDDEAVTTVDREYLSYLEDIALRSGAVDKKTLERKKQEGSPVAEPVGVSVSSRSAASVFAPVPESDDDEEEKS